MSDKDKTRFWVDNVVERILEQNPGDGAILVSSGASPSGSYHIGHLREILTADAVVWGIRKKGRAAKHIHFVDDFDAFRKVPVNVPAEFEKYLGMPLFMTPSPDGNGTYAEYFVRDFVESADALGVDMEVMYSHDKYQEGVFTNLIFEALENMDSIRAVIEKVSGRQLKLDWAPVQILDADNRLNDTTYVSHDREAGEVHYESSDGTKGVARPDAAQVKLDWRIDWPARWFMLGVQVEPFGRDHATKGGSFDTGKGVVEQVFKAQPPIPVPYEFINLVGDTKKMSASKGTGITPKQALDVMPAALLRYFVLKSRPGITLSFDSGQGYGRMIDEFALVENKALEQNIDNGTYDLASLGSDTRVATDIPFNHLVTAFQSAHSDVEETLSILSRSEHAEQVEKQRELIVKFLANVENWLVSWAPDEMKFELQQELPLVELSDDQKGLLKDFAAAIATENAPTAQWYHETMHAIREAYELDPNSAFQALYRVLLNKDSGPKAGWFLSTIDPKWLVSRFEAASTL